MKILISKIFAEIKRHPLSYGAYEDLFSAVREVEKEDFAYAHSTNATMRAHILTALRESDEFQKFFDLYKRSLLFDAPYFLDSYLLYLEIDRKPQDRFYQPRRRVLKQVVDALQELVDDELDELFISMPPRIGKLLADSTPVLTTEGWKRHGDLKVGDYVFNPDGKAVAVIAVHPKYNTTHTVTLSDGSRFKCHFRHEWKVFDRRFGKERILETQEMIGHLENGKKYGQKRGHRYNFQIPHKRPLEGVKSDLPVAPYTLGVWLGDGHNIQPRISGDKRDEAVINGIVADGYAVKKQYTHSKTGVISTDFSELRNALRKLNLCHSHERRDKYIPDQYLTADIDSRLDLLAGLLDTDGCLVKKEHRYIFTTADEKLKGDFISLVSTFGWRCSVKEIQPHTSSSGIVGKRVYWTVSFNPTLYVPCRLERKQLNEFSKQRKLSIISIEESEPEQGNCITVEGGMYLAGRRLIPTHNTTLLLFFVTWLLGRDSEKSNLYSAYSDVITKAFYNGILEIINDPDTYKWHDVFPDSKIVATNSQDETINIDRKKRYPSITCRSLYGTLNGACDCNGVEISDDLIGGIEEALNKDRLVAAWSKVDNNLLPRAKETAKILWCGTRWSIIDPAGNRMNLLENDEQFKNRRYKIINLPALDENDESQFDYDYNVGFSTEYYRQRRASFEKNNDMASWLAQYMGEPVERAGTLFEPDGFRYYNGNLPEGEPDRIFMAVDPAWGGGDFVASPICYQYGEDIFVDDVVYDNNDKKVTQPLIVNKAMKHGVQAMEIEATKTTEDYKKGIEDKFKELDYHINIMTRSAQGKNGKQQRIFDKAPDIRDHMIFRESGKRSKEYELFMQNVFSFKMFAKNKNDDAPDSLCMAMNMAFSPKGQYRIVNRPF
jgi:predicted phage terminase large subunit-like protein